MGHDEFHKLREKLYDAQMPVGADLWQGIEASMRRKRVRRILYYVSPVAAVVLLALILALPGRNIAEQDMPVAAQIVPQESAASIEMAADGHDGNVRQTKGVEDIMLAAVHKDGSHLSGEENWEGAQATDNNVAEAEEKVETVQEEQEAVQVADKVADGAAEKVAEKFAEKASEKTSGNISGRYVASLDVDMADFGDVILKERKYTIAVSQGINPGSTASVTGSRVMASSAFGGAVENSYMVEQVSDTKYSLPVNVGVQLQFPVGRNVALGIGVNYSMLKSKYDCLIDKVHYKVKQKLHYIGVPVNVYGLIVDKNNFSFYVNAGITLEKGLKAVYKLDSYRDKQTHRTDIDGVQFSMNAGLGVEYKFGNTVGLYFEPNLVYYTNSDVMYSIRTDQPFQVKADVGFRFHF